MDGGAYLSEAGSLRDTPLREAVWAGHGGSLQSSLPAGKGRLPVIGEIDVRSLVTRETSRGARPSPPL